VLLGANVPGLLIELGRVDEALERAASLAATDALGATQIANVEVQAAELLVRTRRGEPHLGKRAEELVRLAKEMANADLAPYTFSVAAMAFATEAPTRVEAVLANLERIEGASGSPYYARCLAQIVRSALTAGQREQAERLLHGLTSRYPLTDHAVCATRASLLEDAGDRIAAAALYAEAASRWEEFGNVPERAYALLGHGRCLRAVEPLREARELFSAMGYAPAVAEVDALLAQTTTAVP
jgi:tetratricopeptide (TPR) repeat protein